MKIREAYIDDAEALSNIRKQAGVRETVLALSSERLDTTVSFLKKLNEQGKAYVAEENCAVVGICALMPYISRRRGHCGEISIMVDTDHQGRGIGKALMKKTLAEADDVLQLHRLELSVLVENSLAVSLYEKLGFKIEAKKKSSCIKGGCFVDEYLMGRIRPEATL